MDNRFIMGSFSIVIVKGNLFDFGLSVDSVFQAKQSLPAISQ